MLETKVEFRAAQKERNNIRRQKTAIEAKIKVSTILRQYMYSTTFCSFTVIGCSAETE